MEIYICIKLNQKLVIMKNIFTLIALFFSLLTFSQKDIVLSKITKDKEFTVHSIKFSVNSSEDLQSINWDDVRDNFKDNKPEELIELAFEIDLPESKNKFKSSFKVGGETKNIDTLIKRMKKGVKKMSKLILNYK